MLFLCSTSTKLVIMFTPKFRSKRLFTTIALSGILLGGLPVISWADSNPGFTIFGNIDRKDLLDFHLERGGHPNEKDRYKLYIPPKKLSQGAKKFFVTYPDYFYDPKRPRKMGNGKFDLDRIEVRVDGKSLPIKDVVWDKEDRFIEIDMLEEVEPNSRVTLVFSNMRNPNWGTYYFNCDIQVAGDIPVRYRVGTWVLSINR